MASITIRDLPDATEDTLRLRAAERGLSLETYVRSVLQELSASESVESPGIVELADKYFGPFGDVKLELPSRSGHREIPDFSEKGD